MIYQYLRDTWITCAGTGKKGIAGVRKLQEWRRSASDRVVGETVPASREGRESNICHTRIANRIIHDHVAARLPEILVDVRHNQNAVIGMPLDDIVEDMVVIAASNHDSVAN